MEYHRVRRSIPEQAAGFAPVTLDDAERHRDGVSCKRPAAYVYDANGYERWCIDCNAPLGEEASWHPNGADVPDALRGAIIVLVSLLVLCFVLLGACQPPEQPAKPVTTPTTYGYPTWVIG